MTADDARPAAPGAADGPPGAWDAEFEQIRRRFETSGGLYAQHIGFLIDYADSWRARAEAAERALAAFMAEHPGDSHTPQGIVPCECCVHREARAVLAAGTTPSAGIDWQGRAEAVERALGEAIDALDDDPCQHPGGGTAPGCLRAIAILSAARTPLPASARPGADWQGRAEAAEKALREAEAEAGRPVEWLAYAAENASYPGVEGELKRALAAATTPPATERAEAAEKALRAALDALGGDPCVYRDGKAPGWMRAAAILSEAASEEGTP